MCFFHWVTDPSNDETLEEFESSVENSHFPVATWIYKHQDVYTPQCCVEYIGNTLLLLGKVQFGTVVLCSSTVMKQGLLFWEEWNFCAAKFQLIGVWTFSVGQVGYSGYSVVPWGLWKLEKGKDYQKLIFYFAGVCVCLKLHVFLNICKYFLNLKNWSGSMSLHRACNPSSDELSATLTSWGCSGCT